MKRIFWGLLFLLVMNIPGRANQEPVYCIEPVNLAKAYYFYSNCPPEWQRVPKNIYDKIYSVHSSFNDPARQSANRKVFDDYNRNPTYPPTPRVAEEKKPYIPPVAKNERPKGETGKNIKVGSGTGFFITNAGHIISNNHVIDQCNAVNAYYKGDIKSLKILAIDRKNDLAILKAEVKPDDTFPVAREDAILLEEIYVAGYPFGKSISGSIKVTKGVVSSLSGLGNNYSNLQIDASLQPGNSGGPIINKKGNVVGVAVAKLDYKKVIEAFNTIPENTNFGVKSSTLNQFLNANKVSSSSPKGSEMSIRDIGEKIEKATVYLDCWMTADKIQELKSKRVFFEE
jgi:S1-C subfamily serine protease